MSSIASRLKKLANAVQLGGLPDPLTVQGMTDAELLAVIRQAYPDFPANPTDEQLRAIAATAGR
jgi:hypothetical protein